MKILYVASECAPLAKVGGLGDVAGSLPKALASLGLDVRVIIPYYDVVAAVHQQYQLGRPILTFGVKFAGQTHPVQVFEALLPDSAVPLYLLANSAYLSSGGIYFSKDAFVKEPAEIERFVFFSQAIVTFIRAFAVNWQPKIIHLNDYHTALIPWLLPQGNLDSEQPKTLLTIHNLANQGEADLAILSQLGLTKKDLADEYNQALVKGKLNIMAMGILGANLINTVSPTYAKEIVMPVFGGGLEHLLQRRQKVLSGILNGIDYERWSPAVDDLLYTRYILNNARDIIVHKSENKFVLQQELGLPLEQDQILLAVVTRVSKQKGFDLILPFLTRELGELNAQVVVLGVGDVRYEKKLAALANQHANFVFVNRFDEKLAHRIYASADLFLIPSRFEPCGLTAMIAMRYGTLPIVHAVGGLRDTVEHEKSGFVFEHYDVTNFSYIIYKALDRMKDEWYRAMLINYAIHQDFSWKKPAEEYMHLYQRISGMRVRAKDAPEEELAEKHRLDEIAH